MFQLVEIRHLLNGFLEFLHQVGDIIFGNSEILSCAHVLAAHFVGCAGRIAEVPGDGFPHGLAGIEQPEHDEERHHGGDEICIGNLPGAAVVSTMTRFLLDNDDWAGAILIPYAGAASAAGAADSLPPPRQAFSNSWKVGRTCPGMARRATSTAMMGAVPFRKEKIKTRKTWRKACSSSAAFAMFEASGPTKP